MMNKKAMADIGMIFWKQWAEAFFIILLLLGALIVFTESSAIGPFIYTLF